MAQLTEEDREDLIEEVNSSATIKFLRGRMTEAFMYLMITLGLGGYSIYDAYISSKTLGDMFWRTPVSSVILLMFVVFVISFFLIYGEFPFEKMRSYFAKKRLDAREARATLEGKSPRHILDFSIRRSSKVADGLYGRAGLYLFIGVLIATGTAASFLLLFSPNASTFLSAAKQLNSGRIDISEQMLNYFPRFSFLVFLELIAFYFLRQYRVAMEEFRYYEEIQRKREDSMFALATMETHGTDSDIVDMVKLGQFHSDGAKLKDGESTALLESRKLERSELDVLERIVKAVRGT